MLTLEERERRAYANGDTATAAVLAQAVDLVEDRIDEAEHEARMEKARVEELEALLEAHGIDLP